MRNHLAMMDMLARAAGFKNLQHKQANAAAERRLSQSAPVEEADHRHEGRALRMLMMKVA